MFKTRHGGREQYESPADIPLFHSTPQVHISYIRLHQYWESSKIKEYNKEYHTNVTHGLEIGFTIQGNKGRLSIYPCLRLCSIVENISFFLFLIPFNTGCLELQVKL
jgi:hypothetical protein